MSKVEVKKVKAFPFPMTVKIGATALTGQVVKMSALGIMGELSSGLLSAGDKVDIEFTLPVVKNAIACQGLVMRVVTQLNGPRIAEIHFKDIDDFQRGQVLSYLSAAGVKA